VIGVASIDLAEKLPWCTEIYKPPVAESWTPEALRVAAQTESSIHTGGSSRALCTDGDGDGDGDGGAALTPEEQWVTGEDDSAMIPAAVGQQNQRKQTRFEAEESKAEETSSSSSAKKVKDTGAGVFGAMLDSSDDEEDLPEVRARRCTINPLNALADGDDDDDDEEMEPPKYRKNRDVLEGEAEEDLEAPFETYKLHMGQKRMGGGRKAKNSQGSFRETGRFKGVVRVIFDPEKAKDLFDLRELFKPQALMVRIYVLRGMSFTPMDMGIGGQQGKSDPYLRLSLGKEKRNDRKNYIEDQTDPLIFTCYEMTCTLPGASLLRIDAMDYDAIGGDDHIGSTVIDLEDRWFNKDYRALGEQFKVENPELGDIRLGPKPLELRPLTLPGSKISMGTLEMWIDILTPTEASNFPADDVALPPEEDWEVRLIVWKAKEVVSMDTITDMNDLYAKIWFEGVKPQETDIHWRAKGGKGSFNWRMKFKVWPDAPA
jgi:hypothetical protein